MPSISSFLSGYLTHPKPAPPPITTGTASALLVVYTLIYVVPFYLSSKTRPSKELSRDAPSVIRARIASVTLTCIVCSCITFVILTSPGHASNADALHSMGYLPVGLAETGRALLLTAILFVGPLYETFVVHGAWRDWMTFKPVSELFGDWMTWRNIVAGPLTEEILFRSASVPLMLLAHTPVTQTIFLSPIIFGLAHFHHAYEFRVSNPSAPMAAVLIRSLVQFCYTTLFGAFATFVFLRTGSLLAIFIVHAFCNCMGFPRFWGRLQPADDRTHLATAWSVVYYVLLFVGAYGFYQYLGPLTASSSALVPINM